MAWCEQNRVDCVFGLARNAGSWRRGGRDRQARPSLQGLPLCDARLLVAPASGDRQGEWTKGEANPRLIVTSIKPAEMNGRFLYEKGYCARGEMENRIKEHQGDLFADRTSTATMRANQLRLRLAFFAYVLISALEARRLAHTEFAEATCGTIRLKLLKLAGLVPSTAFSPV
jgi:Transposase DDE domain group 1